MNGLSIILGARVQYSMTMRDCFCFNGQIGGSDSVGSTVFSLYTSSTLLIDYLIM